MKSCARLFLAFLAAGLIAADKPVTDHSKLKTKEAKGIFRQGWVNISTYVVAAVSDRLGDRLDQEQIWIQQGVSGGLSELLWQWAVLVNEEFNRIAPGQQISEVAKRSEIWPKIRSLDLPMPTGKITEINAL